MKQVRCKKNFFGGNSTGELHFMEGQEYKCEVFNDKKDKSSILIYDMKNYNSHYFTYNVFINYFYTEQEIRKIKLEKLNERR